ncbi:MAG: tRNA (adenosine(37)-N6)-threonylcarbamoyltransferase complex transferase subunit TsaD [Pseudomonadota bacterium]
MRTFLGIESSCDETAAAVVRGTAPGPGAILSSVIWDQTQLHAPFGGVVPEIAARAHAERLDYGVAQALGDAGLTLDSLDGIAVTAGPGLIGGLLSGVITARALAAVTGRPLYGVNHLAAHALTLRLTEGIGFPYLMLLASGGHCQFLAVTAAGSFARLGGTIDDAPGEAFDKCAKLLGLGYPGGPLVERTAAHGDPGRFAFPRPLLDRPGCDMSFSGLKTALRRARDLCVAEAGGLRMADRSDLCAGFQEAVAGVLAEKTRRALVAFQDRYGPGRFAVAGGVAANGALRAALRTAADAAGFPFHAPPLALCTDNAAMVAWAGIELADAGAPGDAPIVARPRWPLDAVAAPLYGAGRKGAKA